MLFTLCFPGSPRGQGYSPEAWDLIDALERRIEAGRADQASLDVLLAGLAEDEGCADWEGRASWRSDPDLKAALAEVCPDFPRSAPGSRREAVRVDLAAEGSVHPAEDGLPGPALAGALRGPRGGLRLAATPDGIRRRQAHLEGPAWKARAGQADFSEMPRLAFLTGRRSFPGGGWTAGPEGPWAASSSSLDGLAAEAGSGGLQAAAFGAWSRRRAGTEPSGTRQDAHAYSLAAAWESGAWRSAGQAAHVRLETPGREPGGVFLGGMELRRRDPGLRLGLAGSALPSGGSPADLGAYAEAAWEGGKPGGYLLEAWQATPRWASPLAARPSLLRDTAAGLLLPGRGEGGARLRSEWGLLRAGEAALRLSAAAAAGWALEDTPAPGGGGFLAGEGRGTLSLLLGPWTGESTWGTAWRREGVPAAGSRRTLGQSLEWKGGRWRAEVSLFRREPASGAATWPAAFEMGRRVPEGARWQARLAARDARHPGRDWRLTLDQAWPLGAGLRLSHALRFPVVDGKLREDFGYRVKLEYAGR